MADAGFIPIILGTDIGAYSMARAFYEGYGVRCLCIGRERIGSTDYSSFIDVKINPGLFDNDTFLAELTDTAKALSSSGIPLVLIGGHDTYARMVVENKEYLSRLYIVPYIDPELMQRLVNKDSFYELCGEHGLDYPKTYVYRKGSEIQHSMSYPLIVKPAFSSDYWMHPFSDMHKVYKVHDDRQLRETLEKMYSGGYSGNVVIQEFIPGDDSSMRVLTCYSDRNRKVKLISFGQVVLAEHTPKGIGNYAAIISGYNEELMSKVENFLNAIGYQGLSNFDVKFDYRDNKYKFFEINIRQGRSNYYVTGSGGNLAKCIVDDYVYNNKLEHQYLQDEFYYHIIPNNLVLRHVKDDALQDKIKFLIRQKRELHPLHCKDENSYRRMVYLFLSSMRYYSKYRKNPPVKETSSPAADPESLSVGV